MLDPLGIAGSSARFRFFAACSIVGAVCLGGFFWPAIGSGFQLLLGDLGDWRFNGAILEHWVTFLPADQPWDSPPMFFPERGYLSSSEALALFVPFYALGRILQLSPYYALEFTMATLLALGFVGAVWLLKRLFYLPDWLSIFGGAVYAFAGFRASHLGHTQLYAALLLPFLLGTAVLAIEKLRHHQSGLRESLLLATGTSAMLLTSFYVGWFFLFFLGLTFVSWILLLPLNGAVPLKQIRVNQALRTLLAAAIVFLAGLLPFLWLYLPAYRRAGPRSWEFVSQLLPGPPDLINVGLGNLVWGGAMGGIAPHGRFHGYEMMYGVPIGLLGLFLVTSAVLLLFPKKDWLGRINFDPNASWLRVFALAVILAWLVMVRVGDQSAWWTVFRLVPGASAIRAPYRFQVVLFLPLVIVGMFGLLGLWRRLGKRPAGAILLGAFCALLVAEQVEKHPAIFDARSETAWLKRVQDPPPYCQVFMLLPDPERARPWYAASIDGLLIAIKARLPTINGYSGNFPPGWWGLQDPESEGYFRAATEWIAQHGISKGLCTLQPSSGVWRRLLPAPPDSLLGVNLAGSSPDRLEVSLAFFRSGFYGLELAGRWTNGLGSVDLQTPVSAKHLNIVGKFANPLGGSVRILVNGQVKRVLEATGSTFAVEIPLHEPVRQVQVDSATFVPALLGINDDQRQLGQIISNISLDP